MAFGRMKVPNPCSRGRLTTSRGKSLLLHHSFSNWTQIHPLWIVYPWALILLSIPTKNKLSSSKATAFQVFGALIGSPLEWSLLASTTGACVPWLQLYLWEGSHLSVSFLASCPETLPPPGPILHLRVKRPNQRYGREWPRRDQLESRAPMDWFE